MACAAFGRLTRPPRAEHYAIPLTIRTDSTPHHRRGVLDDPLLERLRRALAPEFVVERRVAAGGMGIVYRAREAGLDRLVAIKVLRPELATAVARERFLREARLLARLQHSNIVPVHRADERDGLSYYVMDFIEGQTLADRLAAGPLPVDKVLRLARDLVEALAAAHAAGIIHRDVKPHNIFFIGHRAAPRRFRHRPRCRQRFAASSPRKAP